MNPPLDAYVKRYNKRMLQFGACGAAMALFISVANERFAYNATNGPFPINGQALAQIKNPATTRKYYLLVQGQKIFATDIGWAKVNHDDSDDATKRTIKGKPTEVLQLLMLDGYLLPVKMTELTKDTTLIGELEPLDKDVQKLLLDEVPQQNLRSRILAMQLKADHSAKAIYWVLCLFVGGIAAVSGFKFLQVFVLWKDFEKHPVGKAIAAHGGFQTNMMAIDEDFGSAAIDMPTCNAIVGRKWLLVLAKKPLFIKMRDIVWAYGSSRNESTQFIKTTHHSTVICTTSGDEILVPLTAPQATQLLSAVGQMAPWAQIGFDGKLALRWSAHRKDVIAEIEKRRDDMQSRA